MDLEHIYHEYFSSVYRYIFSMCRDSHIAEEITQETFFRAVKSIDSYRGESSMIVWLCQIAKNLYFTYLKKERHTVDIDKLDEEQLIDDGVEATILSNEQTHELRYAIHNLDEPYKEVFMLRVYAEMHFRDIGTLFGKSDSWARVTYHRSRLKIIDDLEDKG